MARRGAMIEYLTTARRGEDGKLTVPLRFLDALGLSKGARLKVLRLGDSLILTPLQERFEKCCEDLRSHLAPMPISEIELLTTLPEARQRVYERRYGKRAAKRKTRQRKVLRQK